MQETSQLSLPYQEITKVASRDQLRKELTEKQGSKTTYWIDFKRILVRDRFNLRKTSFGNIHGFAEFIKFNGLPEELTIDVLPDGTCFVEKGHRRLKAMTLLHEAGILYDLDLPHLRKGLVECFVNDAGVDEKTRHKRLITSNLGEKYDTMEQAEWCYRSHFIFGETHEEIARCLGVSRPQVTNLLLLAKQPDDIKQAINKGDVDPTVAIDLVRKIKDSNKASEIIQESVASGKRLTVKEVQSMNFPSEVVTVNEVDNPQTDEDAFKGFDAGNGETIVYGHGVHMPSLNSLQHASGTSGNEPPKEKEHKEKGEVEYDMSRKEIALCCNVITLLDKIENQVSKVGNEQLLQDISSAIGWAQKDMEELREWVRKNKKR